MMESNRVRTSLVLNLDEDTTAFLQRKTEGDTARINTYINQLLEQEKTRQEKQGQHQQNLGELMRNTPDAAE